MRFLQYVSQKSLLRQYCNAKVQKLFQLPPFAVLNLPKVDEETVCHDGFYGLLIACQDGVQEGRGNLTDG